MRAVIQRVKSASVSIQNNIIGNIDRGLCVLIGIHKLDTDKDAEYIIDKLYNLRIFPDQEGKMNLSVSDIRAELLIISQFTLYGDVRKGRRPSYIDASPPEEAQSKYQRFLDLLKDKNAFGLRIAEGEFGGMMDVNLINEGPVTIIIDSSKVF